MVTNGSPKRSFYFFPKSASFFSSECGKKLSFYGKKELSIIYENELLREMNRALRKLKLPPVTKDEVRKFKAEQVIQELISQGSTSENIKKAVAEIKTEDMPFDLLAEIPITDENEKILTATWEKVLKELFSKGTLGQIRKTKKSEGYIRANLAIKFLNAQKQLPKQIFEQLKTITKNRLSSKSIEQLTNFIIDRKAYYGEKVDLEDPIILEKQKIFSNKIEAKIKKKMRKAKSDRYYIPYILVKDKVIGKLLKSVEKTLSIEERELFTTESIRNLIYYQVEKSAISYYYYTSNQIDKLANYRDEMTTVKIEKTLLEMKLEKFINSKKSVKKDFSKKEDIMIDALPYNRVKLPDMNINIQYDSDSNKGNPIESILKKIDNMKKETLKSRRELKKEYKKIKIELKRKMTLRAVGPVAGIHKLKSQSVKIKKKIDRLKKIAKDLSVYSRIENSMTTVEDMKSIRISSRRINVNKLSPQELEFFKQISKVLQKEQEELSAVLMDPSRKEEFSSIEEKITKTKEKIKALHTLLERAEGIRMHHSRVDNLQKELKKEIEEIALQNMKSFMKDNRIPLDRISDLFSEIKVKKGNVLLAEKIYESLTSDLLKEKLSKINQTEETFLLRKEVGTVLKTRECMERLPFSSQFKKRMRSEFSQFEKKVVNEKAKKMFKKNSNGLDNGLEVDLYLSKEVEKDILQNGFTHPSKISPEAIACLIHLTRTVVFLEDRKTNKLDKSMQDEFMEALNKLFELPDFGKLLREIKEDPEEVQMEGRLEQLIPQFIRNFVPVHLKKEYKIPSGITVDVIDLVNQFSKMKRGHDRLVKILLPRAEKLLKDYKKDPASILKSDKLSFLELSQISKQARFIKNTSGKDSLLFELFKNLGLTKQSGVEKYIAGARKACDMIESLEGILMKDFADHYEDGDIFSYVGKKKEAWVGHDLGREEKMTMLLTGGLTHGMKVYHDKENHLHVSHVYQDYEHEQLSIYQAAISDTWRIQIPSLLSRSSTAVLKKAMGDDWKTIVTAKYHEIEKNIHENITKRFKSISNVTERRINAGLADFHGILNLFSRSKGHEAIEGHKEKFEQDFAEIYNNFVTGTSRKSKQICSEFVSKSTLAALMQLNEELAVIIANSRDDLIAKNVQTKLVGRGVTLDKDTQEYLDGKRHYGKEQIVTKNAKKKLRKILKRNGFSSGDIKLILMISDKEVFNLPYDRREKMRMIHPGRMVSILTKKKCVTKVPPSKVFASLIQV